MADLELGQRPQGLKVQLRAGYLFACVMTAASPWTSAPELHFSDGSKWTAIISGADASFAQTSADVDAVLALPSRSVDLVLGGVLWARGVVISS